MKCFTLCTLVLIASAGCGAGADGMVNPDAHKQDTGLSARNDVEARAAKAYAAVFGADVVDTCLNAWANDQAALGRDQFYKPNVAELKAFLCACVGGEGCPDF